MTIVRPCIQRRCTEYAVPGDPRCAVHKLEWERGRWDAGNTGSRGSRPGWRVLRMKAYRYRKGICFYCGRRIGKKNTWECHHLNGDARDDRLDNLGVAHPRCHREAHRGHK